MSVPQDDGFTRPFTAGVDWAKDNHVARVVDAAGRSVERMVVSHSKAGLARLIVMLDRQQVVEVGIERPDGPVIDVLLASGRTVFVIPPSQVKALRGRYGSVGNKDDHYDAYVLADVVRTDRVRLTPLVRDQPGTVALRSLVRARRDLVRTRVAMTNQLRAHLDIALPGVVGLFAELDSKVSRQFLAAFATQDDVDRLLAGGVDALAGWLKGAGYNQKTKTEVLFGRLADAARGPAGGHGSALAGITRAYLAAVTALVEQIAALTEQIDEAFQAHPDKAIFGSLPRAGTLRAARLLAEIGDARGRFPTANSLAGLAGVVPSTRRSGNVTVISFRWSVDKQLRDALCDFAADSRNANPWAADLYRQARKRGHRHPHAVRIVARSWASVIWTCWTTNSVYNPDKHGALQRLLKQQQEAA